MVQTFRCCLTLQSYGKSSELPNPATPIFSLLLHLPKYLQRKRKRQGIHFFHIAALADTITVAGGEAKQQCSLGKYSKFFSARQVALIVEYLGEP